MQLSTSALKILAQANTNKQQSKQQSKQQTRAGSTKSTNKLGTLDEAKDSKSGTNKHAETLYKYLAHDVTEDFEFRK